MSSHILEKGSNFFFLAASQTRDKSALESPKILKLLTSLKKEFESRGEAKNSDYGKGLGIGLAITGVLALTPYVGIIFGIGNLVVWIIYWVIMAKYKAQLMEGESSGGTGIGASHDLLDN